MEFLHHYIEALGWLPIILILLASILLLGKSADVLVDQAVELSTESGIPTVIIGATIVSLGTTLPEATVSVLAALRGSPGLAMGNAVGSVICDTGLILGIACIIRPLPLKKEVVNKQGWYQLAAGFLLVFACLPWLNLERVFINGGNLSQIMGFVFLFFLAIYIYTSIIDGKEQITNEDNVKQPVSGSKAKKIITIFIAAVGVMIAAEFLIQCATIIANRLGIPESVIAATLVAFGTSLPELVTAVSATLKGHGELAVGNIIGADILNILFVAGAAAAITPQGLDVHPQMFKVLFPAMLLILCCFRAGIQLSGTHLKRVFGIFLLLLYIGVTFLSYGIVGS